MGCKLIIDTDPGVDDAFAIALAAGSPEVELLGVTTVFGNAPLPDTTRNARRLLELCGRPDVPVAAGAARPLVYRAPLAADYAHGTDGLSGQAGSLPEASAPLSELDAVGLLAELLEAAEEPVTIAPVGPLTNIALLLAAHPRLHEKIARLVIMGGGLDRGNITSSAEFNVWSDPEAAQRVLTDGGVRCVLVPMDLTYRCAVDAEWLTGMGASGRTGAALLGLTADYRAHYRTALGRDGLVLHDAVAVAEAIAPGTLRTETFPIEVDCGFGPARGTTLADRRRPGMRGAHEPPAAPPVQVATEVTDGVDSLLSFVFDRIAGVR